MSIFIKGLNVPDKYPVKVIINPTGEAFVDYGPYFETLEAVNVPTPHGRLIDADAILSQYNGNILTAQNDYAEGLRDAAEDIKTAPTIIEAEEEE